MTYFPTSCRLKIGVSITIMIANKIITLNIMVARGKEL
jgi:hypothetical protein